MRGILEFVLHGRKGHRNHTGDVMPRMQVRPTAELLRISAAHGGPFTAAIQGAINPDEYLKLENISGH